MASSPEKSAQRVTKLTRTNYATWSIVVETAVMTMGGLEYLSNNPDPATLKGDEVTAYNATLLFLVTSISDSMVTHIRELKPRSPFSIWQKLKEVNNLSTVTNILKLR